MSPNAKSSTCAERRRLPQNGRGGRSPKARRAIQRRTAGIRVLSRELAAGVAVQPFAIRSVLPALTFSSSPRRKDTCT